jgi:rod shape determining protein RodA
MTQYIDTVRSTRRRRPIARLGLDDRPLVARLDWLLLGAGAGLVVFGLWAIAGITKYDVAGNSNYFVVRQLAFAAAGAVLMVAAILVDPLLYRRYKLALYGLMIGLMLLVSMVGTVARGSRRWIDVSFFRFQPSEFGKVLFVICISAFLADRIKRVDELRTPLLAIGLAVPPVLLVFLQPDLGSGLVYLAALGVCLFVAGVRWLHLAVFAAVSIIAVIALLWLLPAAGVQVLKPYQTARLTGFTNPSEDPQGTTYNQRQSVTAVGSGGLSGRGIDGATQTRLDYLPEHATDFAFASLSEQRGFVGAAVLLLLYLLVVWRGLRIVTIASDAFSAIAAAGIVFALLFQVFVNVGMATGIAPVTGITLPFVSVGGSSLVANLAAIGVLEAIALRGRRRP